MTGAPHSSQNFAKGETEWPFRHLLPLSKESAFVAEYSMDKAAE
jgi:hypothetical protein